MKISVIIPTYKPLDYLWECLDSISSQKFPKEDFEILIVLNGCKEPYYSDIHKYINSSKANIRLFQTDESGVSNARNIGIENSKGEYIAFLDDDDYVSHDYLEELYRRSSHNTACISNVIYFKDPSFELIFQNKHHKIFEKLQNENKVSLFKSRSFFNGPCMKLIHRDIIGDRRFDKSFKNGEDNLFMLLISDRIKNVSLSNSDAIYYRRIRIGSASNRKRSKSNLLKNTLRLMLKYTYYWIHNPFGYNVPFVLSRYAAEIKTLCIRIF